VQPESVGLPRLYVNGVLVGTGSNRRNLTKTRLYIGSDQFGQAFNGLIDDVRVYNRALSATEIGLLAAGGQPQTSPGTATLAGNLSLSGSLTLNAGTFDVSSSNYAITLSGSWINNSGTFAPRSGTVTLNGTAEALSGPTTFYNLTKSVTSADTLTFDAGTTQTVSNALTLNGTANALLSLRSSQTGTQCKLDPQGSRTVSYLDVKDSNDVNAAAILCLTGCVDSGNTTNWRFTVTSLALASSQSTNAQTLTLTATISPSTATGILSFYDGSVNLGSAAIANGTASFDLPAFPLSVGTHSFTASYGGSSTYAPSTSSAISPTITLTSGTTGTSGGGGGGGGSRRPATATTASSAASQQPSVNSSTSSVSSSSRNLLRPSLQQPSSRPPVQAASSHSLAPRSSSAVGSVRFTTVSVNLRASYSKQSKSKAQIPKGTPVTLLQVLIDWAKVQASDGKTGYVLRKYLRK
jgi:hypothetical protein